MSSSWFRRVTAIALLATFLPGCSAIFVKEATPNPHPFYVDEADENVPDCTQVQVAPLLDRAVASVGMLLAILGTVGTLSASENNIDAKKYPAIVGAVGVVTLLTFGRSAKYGFEATNECRKLHEPLKKVDHALATGSARAAQHADFTP